MSTDNKKSLGSNLCNTGCCFVSEHPVPIYLIQISIVAGENEFMRR
jgi:hypothetical protein